MITSLFALLFLASFILLIVGLINPTAVIRWGKNRTRKNVLLIFGLATLIFFILFGTTVPSSQKSQILTDAQKLKEIVSSSTQEIIGQQQKTESENKNNANANTNLVKVTRVIDGDTIEIEGGEHVRYIGIDTPETVDPRKPVQCFGVEASNKNKALVEGKMVRLEKDVSDRDKYNRLLRYVYVNNTFINLELVKQGFAYSYSYPPDIKYQDQIVKAQQEAKEAKRGFWNACQTTNITAPIVVPPTNTPTESQDDSSCLIKGNINSSGEKIYHIIGCGSYNQTKIDEARGERWFCTEAEALSAGWRKALNCP